MKVKEYFLFILCLFFIGNPWLIAFSSAENTIQFPSLDLPSPSPTPILPFQPSTPTHDNWYFPDHFSSSTDPNWASYSHASGGANTSTS